MKNSLITIWRSAPTGSSGDQALQAESRASITFDELKHWIASGRLLREVFHYQKAVLRVYGLKLMAQPFATGLILWFLAWGDSRIRDDQDVEMRVSLGTVAALFFKRAEDSLRIPPLLKNLKLEVDALLKAEKGTVKLDLARRPVYLRTDLTFGLKAGGSVGHMAGVLNNLGQFGPSPLFLTTEKVPTVSDSVESLRIVPGPQFWDFREELPLAFNETFFESASALLGKEPPSFVYQRYGLNSFSGVRLAGKFAVPLVLEFNGSEIWVGRQWEKPLKHEELSQGIETLNLQKADLVTVVSRPLKEGLVKQGIAEGKILVNPNGVDPDSYSPKTDGGWARRKYNLEGNLVLGFIGTFGPWHGAEQLAEAFGRLLRGFPSLRDKTRLLMIGDGVRMAQVKERLHRDGIVDLCRLTGLIPQAEGPAHLAACDILVSPTVPNPDGTPFFGSPTKLFEYMAMGKGIVASDLDQIGEILEHDKTAWLVKPGDLESLVQGLKTLIEDGPRRRRLGEAARKEAVAKYTWKEHTRRILEKLKECCS